MSDPVFGIICATYNCGKKAAIIRTLQAVNAQTYPYWKLFLIGDRYEPKEEFQFISQIVPKDKLIAINLSGPTERDRFSGPALWRYGGMKANNFALDLMDSLGYEYMACLDHDDVWHEKHLELLAHTYKSSPAFVTTKGIHMGLCAALPMSNEPLSGNAIHSCCSWNIKKIPFRYRISELPPDPGDADMLTRIEQHCKLNNLEIAVNPTVTVVHQEKGAEIRLHLGCGERYMDGWLNVDANEAVRADYYCDLRKPLSWLPDGSIRLVYSEHFVEHITILENQALLTELYSKLKPGGVCRISTPDLEDMVARYLDKHTWKSQSWIKEFGYEWMPNRCVMMNIGFRDWGHQFIFDEECLTQLLQSIGFSRVNRVKMNESQYPELRNLETRIGNWLIVEAVK